MLLEEGDRYKGKHWFPFFVSQKKAEGGRQKAIGRRDNLHYILQPSAFLFIP